MFNACKGNFVFANAYVCETKREREGGRERGMRERGRERERDE
jgi:hypothetical protein